MNDLVNSKRYTKFNIDYATLVYGFGIELGFVDCSIHSIEDLEEAVNTLKPEHFEAAIKKLSQF